MSKNKIEQKSYDNPINYTKLLVFGPAFFAEFLAALHAALWMLQCSF
jgi:hypothetical protein